MFKIDSKNILRGIIIGLGIILVILALGIAGIRVAGQNKLPVNSPIADQAPEENFKIVYILNKGEEQEILKFDYVLRKGEKQTVFDILKDLSVEKKFELKSSVDPRYGAFIESIAGVANSKESNKYWQYWINDQLGDLGADKKEVKEGDKVEWRFEKVPEF